MNMNYDAATVYMHYLRADTTHMPTSKNLQRARCSHDFREGFTCRKCGQSKKELQMHGRVTRY